MRISCKTYLALKLIIIQKVVEIDDCIKNISITYDKETKKWIAEFTIDKIEKI